MGLPAGPDGSSDSTDDSSDAGGDSGAAGDSGASADAGGSADDDGGGGDDGVPPPYPRLFAVDPDTQILSEVGFQRREAIWPPAPQSELMSDLKTLAVNPQTLTLLQPGGRRASRRRESKPCPRPGS